VLLLKFFILVNLLVIFIQDMLNRAVYWILFPLLIFFCLGLYLISGSNFSVILKATIINAVFLSVQLLLVTAYFFLKTKQWVNITNNLIGWGDVLFMYSTTFFLSVINFLLFYISSLIIVLSIWIVYNVVAPVKNKQVPLAGFQALFLAFVLVFGWYQHINLNSQAWLIKYIDK